MENTQELQRFNEYITHNYNRMLTHLRDTCFFQTFQWSLDYYHDAILTIYRAIQNGSLINYSKVDQLLFVAYKNVAINSDNRDRIVIPSDMSEYEHQLLYEEPEDFIEKERLYDDIYKKRCNKKVKNPALNEKLEPLADKEEKQLQVEHANYMRFAYVGQRLLPPLKYGEKHQHLRYLTAPPKILERGLGINQLARTKLLGERMMRTEVSGKSK